VPVSAYSELHRTIGDNYSPKSANADQSALRQVLVCCRKLGLLDAATEDLIRQTMKSFPGSRARRRAYLEPDEVAQMFASCDLEQPSEARDAALLALLYAGAMRGGEGRSIALEDVSWDSQTVLVTGKGNRQRHVQLSAGSMALLRAWLVHRGEEPGALLCPVDRWAKTHIRHVDGSTVWRWVRRCYQRAGLVHLCPHDLRAACLTRIIEDGDVHQAQLHAGHASPNPTRLYDRTAERRLKATLDGIDFVGGDQRQSLGQKNADSLDSHKPFPQHVENS